MLSSCYPTEPTWYADFISRVGYAMDEDKEIQAMLNISKALAGLEPEVVDRALRWAADRYQVTLTGKYSGRETPPAAAGESSDGQDGDSRQFDDFASLFEAANPKNGLERVLIAAYWAQVVQNENDFDAQSLNKELKNLGHPSGNITRDLDTLMKRNPRLIMQVRKSGASKQARKTYKVTVEGKRAAERMIAGDSLAAE